MTNEEKTGMITNATAKITALEIRIENMTEENKRINSKLFSAKLMIAQLLDKMDWQKRIDFVR